MRKGASYAAIPTTGETHDYLLSSIPIALWRAMEAKASVEGRSVRQVTLGLLSHWAYQSPLAPSRREPEAHSSSPRRAFTPIPKDFSKR